MSPPLAAPRSSSIARCGKPPLPDEEMVTRRVFDKAINSFNDLAGTEG